MDSLLLLSIIIFIFHSPYHILHHIENTIYGAYQSARSSIDLDELMRGQGSLWRAGQTNRETASQPYEPIVQAGAPLHPARPGINPCEAPIRGIFSETSSNPLIWRLLLRDPVSLGYTPGPTFAVSGRLPASHCYRAQIDQRHLFPIKLYSLFLRSDE